MTNLMALPGLPSAAGQNKENQFIDFRLITTREEKSRFFLSCQHNKKAANAAFLVAEETARA
ncbi:MULTISPECIES: hypothetical protein [Serratia]|uniref:hypothetical protein n=1 Tax=Serratia TaxID=613 RepID=UPI00163A94E7|nr:hypothetical protein [Serratia marcescens]MCA3997773.1 hypothetical protein [Serratia marcescens]